MTEQPRQEDIELLLARAAATFRYPTTPDIPFDRIRSGGSLRWPQHSLPLMRIAILALVLLVGLFIVPEVRASVLRFLQIGTIRIFPAEPTMTPAGESIFVPRPTTPIATQASSAPAILEGLVGETTLAEARKRVDFPLRLPAYPADLGAPDRVYLQNHDGNALILVWLEPGEPERVRLSLYVLTSDVFGKKAGMTLLEETKVHGRGAVWVRGPYLLEIKTNDGIELLPRRLVEGNVLIWNEGQLTYRLESTLSLQDAIRVAESLGNP
jgi:hypothetical protein